MGGGRVRRAHLEQGSAPSGLTIFSRRVGVWGTRRRNISFARELIAESAVLNFNARGIYWFASWSNLHSWRHQITSLTIFVCINLLYAYCLIRRYTPWERISVNIGDGMQRGARRVVNPLSARDGLPCPAAISVLELKCYYVSDTFRYSSSLPRRFYFLPTGLLLQMWFEANERTGRAHEGWVGRKGDEKSNPWSLNALFRGAYLRISAKREDKRFT